MSWWVWFETPFAENEMISAPATEGWGMAFEHGKIPEAGLARSAAGRTDGELVNILN